VVLLIDGVEHKNVAVVFSHRDAYAAHTHACSYLLVGVTDVNFLPTGFNKLDAHCVEQSANLVSGQWSPYRTRRDLIHIP
jgi:hypothetical protein